MKVQITEDNGTVRIFEEVVAANGTVVEPTPTTPEPESSETVNA